MPRMLRRVTVLLTTVLGVLAASTAPGLATPSGEPGPARDGRAAAPPRSSASVRAAVAGAMDEAGSFWSGTIRVGAEVHWVWEDSGPTSTVYEVGYVPVGASTTAECTFQTQRTWYEQVWRNTRVFHFVMRNVGGVACGADVVLAAIPSGRTFSTGGINPGRSKSYVFNNALRRAYLLGVTPTGATDTDSCQFEITRLRYARQASGEREIRYTVKNIGTIACVAQVQYASVPYTGFWDYTFDRHPGDEMGNSWYMDQGETLRVVAEAPDPGVPESGTCLFEVSRFYYTQLIRDGEANLLGGATHTNVGNVTCTAGVAWVFLA